MKPKRIQLKRKKLDNEFRDSLISTKIISIKKEFEEKNLNVKIIYKISPKYLEILMKDHVIFAIKCEKPQVIKEYTNRR